MKQQFPFTNLIKASAVLCTGIVVFLVFKPNSIQTNELKSKYSFLKQKLALEEKRNRVLKRELNGLKNDPYFVEKAAREKLGWCLPGETVYRFKE